MAQPGLKTREANIAGSTYRLDFSTFALEALGDAWGSATLDETLGHLAKMQKDGVTLKGLYELVWASLRRYHPEVSIDDVRTLINDHGLGNVKPLIEQISLVIAASMPGEDGKPRPPAAPKRRGR